MNHKQSAYEQGQKEASQGKVYNSPVSIFRDLSTTSDYGRNIIRETKEAYDKGRENASQKTT